MVWQETAFPFLFSLSFLFLFSCSFSFPFHKTQQPSWKLLSTPCFPLRSPATSCLPLLNRNTGMELPQYVVHNILSFLSPRDIYPILSICKLWSSIAVGLLFFPLHSFRFLFLSSLPSPAFSLVLSLFPSPLCFQFIFQLLIFFIKD